MALNRSHLSILRNCPGPKVVTLAKESPHPMTGQGRAPLRGYSSSFWDWLRPLLWPECNRLLPLHGPRASASEGRTATQSDRSVTLAVTREHRLRQRPGKERQEQKRAPPANREGFTPQGPQRGVLFLSPQPLVALFLFTRFIEV